jgi:hypothetical protein
MVRFATVQLRAGILPLRSWFPFLNLGSPQFLHYQSLGAMITGALGLAVGPDTAFRWSLYLLLSLWPLCVYASARLLECDRLAAAACAAMAPFLMSATGVGYEAKAYVWIGYGVWAQLWASVTLPLAWGLAWQWIRHRRRLTAAVVLCGLTLALHFETGYLALMVLLLWPLACGREIAAAARRALAMAVAVLGVSAWVIVPLLDQRPWAAINQALRGGPLANGYGAGRMLGWLASGELLDHGRLPVITAAVAVGIAVALTRARRRPAIRALLLALAASLLLSFGRTTFGPLADILPGSSDLFFRRFQMGVQLACLLLAGLGVRSLLALVHRLATRVLSSLAPRRAARSPLASRRAPRLGAIALVALLAGAWLLPAILELGGYEQRNAAAIVAQRAAERNQEPLVGRLLAIARASGPGRVYAGTLGNWGRLFTVGAVPLFKLLEDRDVDEVGYTLRTASLMSQPELRFQERNPGDYALFGIRYLLVPGGMDPPVRARFRACAGPYCLWELPSGSYFRTGTIAGALPENRADVGSRSAPLLRSALPQRGLYLRVRFGVAGGGRGVGRAAVRRALSREQRSAPGQLGAERVALAWGVASAIVHMRRRGIVVLSASYDPGWQATIDGQPVSPLMVAPALVAVPVGVGLHTIAFRYRGYGGYPWLLGLAAGTLAVLAIAVPGRRR